MELFIRELGWVTFDPSHKKCIDENYVRISYGYDFIVPHLLKEKLNYFGGEDLNFKLELIFNNNNLKLYHNSIF